MGMQAEAALPRNGNPGENAANRFTFVFDGRVSRKKVLTGTAHFF